MNSFDASLTIHCPTIECTSLQQKAVALPKEVDGKQRDCPIVANRSRPVATSGLSSADRSQSSRDSCQLEDKTWFSHRRI